MRMKVPVVRLLVGVMLCASVVQAESGKARFVQRLDKGETVTVATLGTSLTGGRWRWVDAMKTWLDEDFPGLVTVHNLGVGASASETVPAMKENRWTWKHCGLDHVKKAVVLEPDAVFIEFAVNDAYLPYGISIERSKANLNAMIDQVLAANPACDVVLMTMNAVTGEGEATRPELAAYYQNYGDVAQARGLHLVDCYPVWDMMKRERPTEFRRLVPDGMHPQAAGYRQVLLPLLKAAVAGAE